ncbi:DUF6879 family protein [Streptomyces sp. NPDC101062]|uniref:DUF6879 family protein n=1 Tax=unclassified Streptomyces TaxID=2593676 RepID=UPI003810D435
MTTDLTLRDPLPPILQHAQGTRLDSAAYRADFRTREAAVRGRDSWKLERLQHFEEQGSPSRDALSRGDWAESLRLMDGRRDALLAERDDDRLRGTTFHRVRVVETPLTPYVQWELHSLRQQMECGGIPVSVIHAAAVERTEAELGALLPEVVILGGETLYQVLYTNTGLPDGAVRHTQESLIAPWESYIHALHRAGEPVTTYVDREVAHLPPPRYGR